MTGLNPGAVKAFPSSIKKFVCLFRFISENSQKSWTYIQNLKAEKAFQNYVQKIIWLEQLSTAGASKYKKKHITKI